MVRFVRTTRHIHNSLLTPTLVIHFCTSTAAARTELPLVLASQFIPHPQTNLGSNRQRSSTRQRRPTSIFVGAGFDQEDYEAFRTDVGELASGLTWVREEKSDVEGLEDPANWVEREGMGRIPRPEVLIRSVGKVLRRDLLGGK